MNTHLKQIKKERSQEESTVELLSPRKDKKGKIKREVRDEDIPHLRQLILDTTGIEPAEQELTYFGMRMTDDSKTLAEYGIGQGGVIMCSKKETHGQVVENATTAAKLQQKAALKYFDNDPKGSPKFEHEKIGNISKFASSLPIQHNNLSLPGCTPRKGRPGFRMMPRWQTDAKPRMLEPEPTAVLNPASNNIYVFDYASIRDHGHGGCHLIRRAHGIS